MNKRTLINHSIAKQRNFTCLTCRKSPPEVEFTIAKSGYFCQECALIINVMSVSFIIIVGIVLFINAVTT